jgi:uncharacterized protein (DUF433 family)
VPASTLKSWVSGHRYVVASGPRFWQPLIERSDRKDSRLSFSNLIEAHVLSALQKKKSEILQAYWEPVEWDLRGLPIRIFPLTRFDYRNAPRFVMTDPIVAFGRSVIEKAIKTSVIAERFKAGESIEGIAEDYDLEASEVEEDIRYEALPLAA